MHVTARSTKMAAVAASSSLFRYSSCTFTVVRAVEQCKSYSTFKTTKIKPFPRLRSLDSTEKNESAAGVVKDIVYNYYRAPLAMVVFGNQKEYFVATKNQSVGQIVYSGRKAPIGEGNCLPLGAIPVGSLVSSLEMRAGDGGKLARGCGNSATILFQDKGNQTTLVRLPSGEKKTLPSSSRAIMGVVARGEKRNEPIGKAGRAFHIYRYNKNWPRAHHKYRQRH